MAADGQGEEFAPEENLPPEEFGDELPPEENVEPEEPHEPDGGDNRYQRMANDRRQALDDLERERERNRILMEQMQQRPQPQPFEDDLDPDEKWRRDTQTAVNTAMAQAADARDAAAFDRLCSRNQAAADMADEVERKLAEVRKMGQNPTREGLLAFMIGEKALRSGSKPTNTQRRTQARVDEARGAPGGRRQTTPAPASPPEDSQEARIERLRGVQI